jgi:hypothetical protein
MFGVQAAVIAITCLVVIVMLLTAPWWMRALSAFASAVSRQFARADAAVAEREPPKDVIEGEFREVDK